MTSVAVAGATGAVGRHVVTALHREGIDVVPIARSQGVDLISGRGVHAALYGVSAVVDASNVTTVRESTSVAFFRRATTTLINACQQNRVPRLVVLSIVGVDRIGSGYYAGKLEQERLAVASGLSVTIVRTTQFHEFALQLLERFGVGPVALIPPMLARPVAARAVADRLAELAATGLPVPTLEMAGPECLYLPEMVRRLCRSTHRRTIVGPLPVPGRAGRAMAAGALLPHGQFEMDTQTFDDWLAARAAGT